jgi:hypothetical protein
LPLYLWDEGWSAYVDPNTLLESSDNMKEKINNILLQMQSGNIDVGEASNQLFDLFSSSFTEKEVDFAYCIGIFNTGGIDKLSDELNRLKELKKEPTDLILAIRHSSI